MSPTSTKGHPARLFYSYAHKDEKYRDELDKHLTGLQRQGVIQDWHDRKIIPGEPWEEAIGEQLQKADIILLLVSPDFIASDYCWGVEVAGAMARHQAGEARVVPIIVRPADWNGAVFGGLQALPKNAKPVSMWTSRDEAWLDVVQGIRRMLEEQRPEYPTGRKIPYSRKGFQA